MSAMLWWVTVTDWRGVQVYDGPAPAPSELVLIDQRHPERLFRFDMQPMGLAEAEGDA